MMNLYKILFEHFSQKDSEKGIVTYLVAESDEKVYEWIRSEPDLQGGIKIWAGYADKEEDIFDVWDNSFNIIGEETFKERMLRLKGEMFDEEYEPTDLYYGLTLYGWELIKENAKPDVLQRIEDYGISIEQYNLGGNE